MLVRSPTFHEFNKTVSFIEQEVTCSCTRKRSSITWDIAREMYARDVCRIAAMLCDSMLCFMVYVKPSYDASYSKVSNLQAVADTRWRSMAGRTAELYLPCMLCPMLCCSKSGCNNRLPPAIIKNIE
ncbi:hypothetical protein TIFTF001_026780 [Ficus carica]|uniref:Uncharacterized protein n=1 Tax=Ficus carica TaxID=3494 RepID=A0AA88DLT6_FICCA|nr:hypothetical protein TIFTF001_026780 [Ficus carica]